MLSPYIRPQDTITQILQQTPAVAQSRRNPIVIGPEYKLMLNDGRELSKHAFTSAGATHPYEVTAGNALDLVRYAPKADDAVLVGEDLEAQVASFGSGLFTVDTDLNTNAGYRNVRLGTNALAGSGTLNTALDGRSVRVGDVLNVASLADSNATVMRRQVTELLGAVTPATLFGAITTLDGDDTADTNATAAEYLVPESSTAGYTATGTPVFSNVTDFRSDGALYLDGASNKYLGDEITVEFTTSGAAGVAVVTISSLNKGLTQTGLTTVDATSDHEISLAGIGYTAATTILVDAVSAVAGDTLVIRVFPIFTPGSAGVDFVMDSGVYTASVDRRYIVEVTAAGAATASVRVYDTSGAEPVTNVSDPETAFALGTGGFLAIFPDIGDVYVGQKFYVDAVAAVVSTTEFDGVRLDGPAVNADDHETSTAVLTATTVFQRYTGPLDNTNVDGGLTEPLSADATDFTYVTNLGLSNADTGRSGADHSPFAGTYGKILLSYKAARVPTALEGTIELRSASQIADDVGESGIENWLGRGCVEAFNGNQKRVVYALRTVDDSVASFTDALKKIKTTDQVYALVVLSDDPAVQKLVADHCEEMSNKFNKNFRRCYVGTDSPGSYLHWGLLNGVYRKATLASTVVTIEAADRANSVFSADDIGASVTLLGLGGAYVITDVLSAYECVLDIDTGISVAIASGITLTRPDTPEATALYVRDRSKALASRRAVNVWSDNPTTTDASLSVEVLPSKFVAAEIAGLRCALLPQQGLTLTEVLSVDAAPGMYARFTPELLDDVAADGTMVVTQEAEGGDIFIRHQLTTDVDNGALAYEDNVGVIVDEFSYDVKDGFRKYIGRRNATADTIELIRIELKALATGYTQADLIDSEIGAPALTFFDEEGKEGEVTVRQDGDLADTLLTYTKLRIPLPLNGINHYIDVETAVEL